VVSAIDLGPLASGVVHQVDLVLAPVLVVVGLVLGFSVAIRYASSLFGGPR
jgi:hypothetical protein